MTDQMPPEMPAAVPPAAPTAQGPASLGPVRCRPRHRGRKVMMTVALLGSFFAGGVLFSHMNAFSEEGPGWMHRVHWTAAGPRLDPPPMPSPAERIAHGRDMVGHVLTAIEANADQRTKILAIYDATAAQLKDAPIKVFQDKLALATLLTAPTIDHARLEAERASAIGDLDGASKILTKAIGDAADVLNQDQRTRLAMMASQMPHPPHPPRPHEPMAGNPPPPPAPAPAPAP